MKTIFKDTQCRRNFSKSCRCIIVKFNIVKKEEKTRGIARPLLGSKTHSGMKIRTRGSTQKNAKNALLSMPLISKKYRLKLKTHTVKIEA